MDKDIEIYIDIDTFSNYTETLNISDIKHIK